ncbi:MAG: hypothetical protein HY907_14640 [Deltaproteobacteria bacterium]|nr:hypothetical protein [Deltaproteobacteria bacterium]
MAQDVLPARATEAEAIPAFDRHFFDGSEKFTRIGGGAVGGKAAGLALIRDRILSRLDPGEFPELVVAVPTLTVIATDLFDAFVQRNGLLELAVSDEPDDRVAHAFQRAELPAELPGDLRALAEKIHVPLAVRSSSMLEDALAHPFAGVYATKMIPNDALDADTRFRKLVEAVKFVWASAFSRDAKSYRRSIGIEAAGEHMAVIVQEIVGRRRGGRFHPDLAGVARSYNYYPTGHAVPADGVVNLALGLGKTIVDGGTSWTYSPAHPKAPQPFNSIRELLHHSQTRFWTVRMGRPPAWDPIRESEYLEEPPVVEAESDDAFRLLVSTYDPESDRLVPGAGRDGPRLVDFAPILKLEELPLNGLLRRLLALSEDAVGGPVELEFAATLDVREGLRGAFGFLQVRPMAVSGEAVQVSEADLDRADAIVTSSSCLGNGTAEVTDVVYLKPDAFEAGATPAIAVELERVNRALLDEGRRYLLIGFGRWGSSEPWLGVPVTWGQIAGVRAMVEATLPQMSPDLSQGSHFFHNLIGCGVFYLCVPRGGERRIDWDWLARQPAVVETAHVRHVRSVRPVRIVVDGRNGRAVVLRDGGHGG